LADEDDAGFLVDVDDAALPARFLLPEALFERFDCFDCLTITFPISVNQQKRDETAALVGSEELTML
jgi:hypothetical protein